MRHMTSDHKEVLSTLPDLLEVPGRSEPGEPVHGDLLDVLVDQSHSLAPVYSRTVGVLRIGNVWQIVKILILTNEGDV